MTSQPDHGHSNVGQVYSDSTAKIMGGPFAMKAATAAVSVVPTDSYGPRTAAVAVRNILSINGGGQARCFWQKAAAEEASPS